MLKTLALIIAIFSLVNIPVLSRPVSNDPISGDWDGTFHVLTFTLPGKMSLKLHKGVVTGTVETEHTGGGTIIDGTWKDGKLNFTAKFEKHESILFTGVVKDGKLSGTFTTEGNTGQWTAERHKRS